MKGGILMIRAYVIAISLLDILVLCFGSYKNNAIMGVGTLFVAPAIAFSTRTVRFASLSHNRFVGSSGNVYDSKTMKHNRFLLLPLESTITSKLQLSSIGTTGTTMIPLTLDEMIRQAATCMKKASMDGKTRQIVRILAPRDSSAGDFGTYFEAGTSTTLSFVNSNNIKLVPPDESWQGGIMQLYRAVVPVATEIIRKIVLDTTLNNVPSRIVEDRTVDESGVDGVSLLRTDDNSISCWIQPTQENVDEFVKTAKRSRSDQLVVLLNPQWRQVNDALDTASMTQQENSNNNIGFLRGLANFLGGKGAVVEACQSAGFVPVYTLEQYVCRGANIRLLQMYDSSIANDNENNVWNVYCERDDLETYVLVGTNEGRPTYQQVEDLLTKADIGYKYARDIGLQPKL